MRDLSEDQVKLVQQQRCPDCIEGKLKTGPRGGASVNVACVNCGSEFNDMAGVRVERNNVPGFPDLRRLRAVFDIILPSELEDAERQMNAIAREFASNAALHATRYGVNNYIMAAALAKGSLFLAHVFDEDCAPRQGEPECMDLLQTSWEQWSVSYRNALARGTYPHMEEADRQIRQSVVTAHQVTMMLDKYASGLRPGVEGWGDIDDIALEFYRQTTGREWPMRAD